MERIGPELKEAPWYRDDWLDDVLTRLPQSFDDACTRCQLEPNELAADPLPSRDDRRLLFFYEAAEGGAGVLRQVAET